MYILPHKMIVTFEITLFMWPEENMHCIVFQL